MCACVTGSVCARARVFFSCERYKEWMAKSNAISFIIDANACIFCVCVDVAYGDESMTANEANKRK